MIREVIGPLFTVAVIVVFFHMVGHFTTLDPNTMMIGALLYWKVQDWWGYMNE